MNTNEQLLADVAEIRDTLKKLPADVRRGVTDEGHFLLAETVLGGEVFKFYVSVMEEELDDLMKLFPDDPKLLEMQHRLEHEGATAA